MQTCVIDNPESVLILLLGLRNRRICDCWLTPSLWQVSTEPVTVHYVHYSLGLGSRPRWIGDWTCCRARAVCGAHQCSSDTARSELNEWLWIVSYLIINSHSTTKFISGWRTSHQNTNKSLVNRLRHMTHYVWIGIRKKKLNEPDAQTVKSY